MQSEKINNTYWKKVKPELIIGKSSEPSDDFYFLLPPRARVLDIGCGDGHISEKTTQRGFLSTGIDINPAVIKNNKIRGSAVNYKTVDITKDLEDVLQVFLIRMSKPWNRFFTHPTLV